MIVYLKPKTDFCEDVLNNRIGRAVQDAYESTTGRKAAPSERAAWDNSLQRMRNVVETNDIPADAGIGVEFGLPQSSRRIDFIISGFDSDNQRRAVIVELKQWTSVARTTSDAVVRTWVGGGERNLTHPSYQAWAYAAFLEDYNEAVRDVPIGLHPCAYLHNCQEGDSLRDPFYAEHLAKAPLFIGDDVLRLRAFIAQHVRRGDRGSALYVIRDGRIRPSKSLADSLGSLLNGNREFVMLDEQKLAYEMALALPRRQAKRKHRQVLVVRGGPGTGKSVVAVNLLVEFTRQNLLAQYITKNAAPRAVFAAKLSGSLKRSRIDNLFKGPDCFHTAQEMTFDVLVVDEAHRLNARSGIFKNKGENQVRELISAARSTVFFVDDDQVVTWSDIGSRSEILAQAQALDAEVQEIELPSQFRCSGSDGYLGWLDNLLGIRETANTTLEGIDFDFVVCRSAQALRSRIQNLDAGKGRARLVAGYCWDWSSKSDPTASDIVLADGFRARWNLAEESSLWIIRPDSLDEVGCIHTCQGLEIDHIGVIIGPDLVIRNGTWVAQPDERAATDQSLKGSGKASKSHPTETARRVDRIIRNTYRTLLSRGKVSCAVVSTDPETQAFLQQRSLRSTKLRSAPAQSHGASFEGLPLRVLGPDESPLHRNAVPVFDLAIAAGGFSPEQQPDEGHWCELPPAMKASEGLFVARVVGDSMNRRVPSGSWALFTSKVAGSREGKVVLVSLSDPQDPDGMLRATLKLYSSEKRTDADGWRHERILLKPDSSLPGFKDIVLTPELEGRVRFHGVLLKVLH